MKTIQVKEQQSGKTTNHLFIGFTDNEVARATAFLKKLLPYLQQDEYCLVGGVVIRYHVINGGLQYPSRPLNDIDLMAKNSHSISPRIAESFMIAHFHPGNSPNQFYLVVVDPDSKLKGDIFDWRFDPKVPLRVPFEGTDIPIRTIEDQLVTTVHNLQKIASGITIDPKQFEDTKRLIMLADPARAEAIWQSFQVDHSTTLVKAIEFTEATAVDHPELVREKPHHRPPSYICTECVDTPDFPLTPLKQIYNTLGYLE